MNYQFTYVSVKDIDKMSNEELNKIILKMKTLDPKDPWYTKNFNMLIAFNYTFILKLINRFHTIHSQTEEDKISICLIGIQEAIYTYNPKESAFLTWCHVILYRRMYDMFSKSLSVYNIPMQDYIPLSVTEEDTEDYVEQKYLEDKKALKGYSLIQSYEDKLERYKKINFYIDLFLSTLKHIHTRNKYRLILEEFIKTGSYITTSKNINNMNLGYPTLTQKTVDNVLFLFRQTITDYIKDPKSIKVVEAVEAVDTTPKYKIDKYKQTRRSWYERNRDKVLKNAKVFYRKNKNIIKNRRRNV